MTLVGVFAIYKCQSIGGVIGFDLSSVYKRPSMQYTFTIIVLYLFTAISLLATVIGIALDIFQ